VFIAIGRELRFAGLDRIPQQLRQSGSLEFIRTADPSLDGADLSRIPNPEFGPDWPQTRRETKMSLIEVMTVCS
jgi:hypothetical protein